MLSFGRVLARSAVKRHGRFLSSTVQNNQLLSLTFVDEEGNRATVKARVGQTLLEAAIMHKIDIEHPCDGLTGPVQTHRTKDWLEDTYGEGPGCYACHVKIPSSYEHLLPKEFDYIREGMTNLWGGEVTKTSRLACQITLEKKHDGMVVFVPDPPLTDMCI